MSIWWQHDLAIDFRSWIRPFDGLWEEIIGKYIDMTSLWSHFYVAMTIHVHFTNNFMSPMDPRQETSPSNGLRETLNEWDVKMMSPRSHIYIAAISWGRHLAIFQLFFSKIHLFTFPDYHSANFRQKLFILPQYSSLPSCHDQQPRQIITTTYPTFVQNRRKAHNRKKNHHSCHFSAIKPSTRQPDYHFTSCTRNVQNYSDSPPRINYRSRGLRWRRSYRQFRQIERLHFGSLIKSKLDVDARAYRKNKNK